MLEDSMMLRDVSNFKQRVVPTIADKGVYDEVLTQKESLHRTRMELCRQIQKDAGRSRIENL